MTKRNAAGVLMSNDGLWWWDGSRWHPATSATAGKPPRAPGSPWPWVLAALLALALVTAVPLWVVWNRGGGSTGWGRGYAGGFARTYLQERQTALGVLEAKLAGLSGCEHAGVGPCYPPADDLAAAAENERGTVSTESGLFYFPSCLRGSASGELAPLQQVHDAAEAIRLDQRESPAVRLQLQAMSTALQQAQASVAASPC